MIQTVRIARLELPDGITYLDVTWDSPGIDPDSEVGAWLYEGNLISVTVVNTSLTITSHALVRRGQGQNFFSVDIPPGTNQTFLSGGPVKTVSDIPLFSLSV